MSMAMEIYRGMDMTFWLPETEAALRAVLPAEASVSNPVDMLGSATEATYEQVLPQVLADPGIDAVIVLFVLAAVLFVLFLVFFTTHWKNLVDEQFTLSVVEILLHHGEERLAERLGRLGGVADEVGHVFDRLADEGRGPALVHRV